MGEREGARCRHLPITCPDGTEFRPQPTQALRPQPTPSPSPPPLSAGVAGSRRSRRKLVTATRSFLDHEREEHRKARRSPEHGHQRRPPLPQHTLTTSLASGALKAAVPPSSHRTPSPLTYPPCPLANAVLTWSPWRHVSAARSCPLSPDPCPQPPSTPPMRIRAMLVASPLSRARYEHVAQRGRPRDVAWAGATKARERTRPQHRLCRVAEPAGASECSG
ncbi:hypothetical protein GGF50DRAFT_121783 [Schizophyllum commune]